MSIKHGIVSGESVSEISELIFCGWEFTMCSKETAKLRHKNLYNEFKVLYCDTIMYYDTCMYLFYFSLQGAFTTI